jgi:hypothetical protein
MNTTELDNLYDRKLVDDAISAHSVAETRHAETVAAHDAAVAGHKEAARLSARAVAGLDGLDPLACERDLHDRAMQVSVAVKVRDHAADVKAKLAEQVTRAKGLAAKPIAEAGFRALYLASVKHDAAEAMKKEADEDRAKAVAVCLIAHGHGLDYVQASLNNTHSHVQMTASERRLHMVGNRINPDTGVFG